MKRYDKKILVNVDAELGAWLDNKVSDGYNKSSVIRSILHQQMDKEGCASPKQPVYSIPPSPQEEHVTQQEPKLAQLKEAVLFYRQYPWAIDRIEDEQGKAFVIDTIKKIEETLPVGGPLPEIKHKRGRPSKAVQSAKEWYGPNYKPQRAPDGSKIGTPRTGAKYEDMETSLAVLAWSLDNPGEPMPRWLYDAQTQWYIEQYKKTHKY
jgi:hypothetical protein